MPILTGEGKVDVVRENLGKRGSLLLICAKAMLELWGREFPRFVQS